MNPGRIYIALVALNLAGFPFVAVLSQALSLSSTPLSVTLRSAILFGSALILAWAMFARVRIARGRFWLLLGAFWIAYLLRIAHDTVLDNRALMREHFDYWIWSVGACLIPMLAMLTYPRRPFIDSAFKIALTFALVVSAMIGFLGSGSHITTAGQEVDIGRLGLQSLNPISAGHVGASLVLLAGWALVRPCPEIPYPRLIGITGCALGLFVLLASASRGPIVALLLVVLLFWLSQSASRMARAIPLVAGLVIVMAQGMQYLEMYSDYPVVSRITGTLSGNDAAVVGRQVAVSGAISQFLDNPIIGDSLEERTTGFYPHNIVVEALMATGLVGTLPLIALLLYGVRASYRLMKLRHESGWVALIFLQYLFAAQFSGALYSVTTMWVYLAMTIAANQMRAKLDLRPDRESVPIPSTSRLRGQC